MSCDPPPAAAPAKPAVSSFVPATPDEKVAIGLVDELARGAWAHPRTAFAPALSQTLPPDKLHAEWLEIEAVAGSFFEVREAKTEASPTGNVVHLRCVFAKTVKIVKVTLDDSHAVTAFHWAPAPELLESRTRQLIEKANEGDFVAAGQFFGPRMRQAMPPERLSAAWKELEGQVGKFRTVEDVTLESQPQKKYGAVATASFERAKILVRVFYDDHDEVIGLFFAPVSPWSPPSYAGPNVDATEVVVGDNPGLPGTLTVPKGDAAVPAVVLIHGSGPGDRNEAIGGVRVFEDIALGLSARGIAVLRYDKRSRVSPAGVITEKEEVLDGAAAAIALLKKTPRIDPRRIFVLGHSQGGNLAPRIAAAAPDIAGYIVMAGNTRPLQDLVVDQYQYFAMLHPDSEELKKKIAEAHDFKTQVESPALKPADRVITPFGGGLTGAYFLYQRGYDPVDTAQKLALPILVLQGGRDYQVGAKDLERWKTGLAGSKFATIKQYPAVNHLFVTGSGPPGPEEYQRPGHVDEEVIRDIADWIAKKR